MPAQSLLGLTTPSGWTVTKQLNNTLGSGGNFCVRYIVESGSGQIGFLKAMDLSGALGDLTKLQGIVNEYLFEQNILNVCKDKKLNRVVTPLDAGKITLTNFQAPLNDVYYVIFEKAECNLREYHLEIQQKLWIPAFSALHHVAVGIEQLHNNGIAHQDIKPSNVLAFKNLQFKVSDLGRVVDQKGTSPFCFSHYPGDPTYKPTEMFFGLKSLEFNARRACDMYMGGSLVFHIIEDAPINIAILNEAHLLDNNIRQKPYDEALPFLMSGFNTILRRYRKHCEAIFDEKIAGLLANIVYEMCHPDVTKRGNHNISEQINRYSIRSYAGKLGNLVRYAKVHGVK